MRNKKMKFIFVIIIVSGIGLFLYKNYKNFKPDSEIVKKTKPVMGSIQNFISTTGTVLPKNRLEVKPPVPGRIESVLVKEGDVVKVGQTIALMSSTERAALLDSARGQGEESLKYWEATYKAIPLISPIDGEVIVAKTQPGQTVSSADPIIILSDKLIVRAQVDETDIGKIKLEQKAIIILDAYPETKINAMVDHIYYESQTVNNVTVYEVDLMPAEMPSFFRSGMNATTDFLISNKDNIMLIPVYAVFKEKDINYVFVEQGEGQVPEKREVKLGVTDDKNVEVISGLGLDDVILEKSKKYSLPKSDTGTNPFMPQRSRSGGH